MSFQILSVTLDGQEFQLSKNVPTPNNKISIITGKNGTGKSRILEHISTSFMVSDDFLREQPNAWDINFNRVSSFNEQNKIKYIIDRHEVDAKQIHRDLALAFVTDEHPRIRNSVFPNKLICLSTSPFDRFPPHSKKIPDEFEDSIYSY
ncbi:hypothetical protein CAG70_19150, partial [Photobacterium halotolerans]|nr:hypothetical protein [Photobacterium halotolerans]